MISMLINSFANVEVKGIYSAVDFFLDVPLHVPPSHVALSSPIYHLCTVVIEHSMDGAQSGYACACDGRQTVHPWPTGQTSITM